MSAPETRENITRETYVVPVGSSADRRPTSKILRTIVWVLCALALCSLAGRWMWIGNLAGNVSAHLIVCIMLTLLFCKHHARCAAALLLAMGALSWPWVWDAYQPRAQTHDGSEGIHCMLVNTAWWNDDHQAAAEDILQADPDLVVIIEAHPALIKILKKSKQWNFNYGTSRVGPYSQVVLSKLRIENPKQHPITGALRVIDADVAEQGQAVASMLVYEWTMHEAVKKGHTKGQAIRFIVAHPPAFTRPRYRHDRKKVFAKIQKIILRSKESCVLLGDLNNTIASYEWRELATLGLRRATGPHQRTWGIKTSDLRHLGLEIDHLCVQDPVQMTPLQYTTVSGSDHVAVHTVLKISE